MSYRKVAISSYSFKNTCRYLSLCSCGQQKVRFAASNREWILFVQWSNIHGTSHIILMSLSIFLRILFLQDFALQNFATTFWMILMHNPIASLLILRASLNTYIIYYCFFHFFLCDSHPFIRISNIKDNSSLAEEAPRSGCHRSFNFKIWSFLGKRVVLGSRKW